MIAGLFSLCFALVSAYCVMKGRYDPTIYLLLLGVWVETRVGVVKIIMSMKGEGG